MKSNLIDQPAPQSATTEDASKLVNYAVLQSVGQNTSKLVNYAVLQTAPASAVQTMVMVMA